MKSKIYPIYFLVMLLSVYMSHLFYINQTTYFKTDITIKVGRYLSAHGLNPILLEDIAMVEERLRGKNFILENFSKEYQKYISDIEIRTFRNGDSLVLSLVTKKIKPDEQTNYKKIMENVATSLIQVHDNIRSNTMIAGNREIYFTKTYVTSRGETYAHKKFKSHAQIIFLGIIIGVILSFSLRKLIFFRKK